MYDDIYHTIAKNKKKGKQFLFQSDMNNEDETTHITTFALHLDGAIPISLGLSWPLTYFLPPFGSGVAPSTFTFKPLFDFELYLGKIPILTHIFSDRCFNHQLEKKDAYPRCSMFGIFTYMYKQKSTIHVGKKASPIEHPGYWI